MSHLPPDPLFPLPFRQANAKKTEWPLLLKFIRTNHGTKVNVGPAIDRMAELRKQIAAVCVPSMSESVAFAVPVALFTAPIACPPAALRLFEPLAKASLTPACPVWLAASTP